MKGWTHFDFLVTLWPPCRLFEGEACLVGFIPCAEPAKASASVLVIRFLQVSVGLFVFQVAGVGRHTQWDSSSQGQQCH